MVDFAIVPNKTALLNVDFQNVFVEGYPVSAPDGVVTLQRANRLSAACRAAGILVIHTAHVTRPDGSNVGVMGEILPPVGEGMIAQGSQAAALHKDLDVNERDIILEKPRFGAFHGPGAHSSVSTHRYRHRHGHCHERVRRNHGPRGQRSRLSRDIHQ